MNKHPLELRTRLDVDQAPGAAHLRERLYRVGRIFLFAGAGTIGVEMIIDAIYGAGSSLTFRSIFDLAPESVLAHILAPLGFILDKPLWLLLLVAGAATYAVAAVDQLLRESTGS